MKTDNGCPMDRLDCFTHSWVTAMQKNDTCHQPFLFLNNLQKKGGLNFM